VSDVTSIDQLLEQMVQLNASDLHLTVGAPPVVRLKGHLQRFDGVPAMSADNTRDLLYRILSTEQQKRLELARQLDFAHSIPGIARFRVNVFFQRETLGAAFRLIPNEIKSLEELGLSSSLHQLAEKPRGLVLVTGPTGSGKSTTLASVIDEINRTRHDHILTVEDVILVGEMRDLETIATAMTAAETGHLVFGTLHTQSAPGTIDRIIDVFPPEQQEQVRVQIAGTLQGVVTQALLPTADGAGRVPALEILLPDDAVRNLIRQGKVEQIYSVMQTGTSKGMVTMEQSLAELVIRGIVSMDIAVTRSSRPEQLQGLLERAGYVDPNAEAAEENGHSPTAPAEPVFGGLRVSGS
jgi:twitching motility protein PilT